MNQDALGFFKFNLQHIGQTIFARLPDAIASPWPIRLKSLVPIYHPAVFMYPRSLNGVLIAKDIEEAMQMLKDEKSALAHPCNLDAAVCLSKTPDKYIRINQQLAYNTDQECSICLEELQGLQPIGHY